MMSSGQDGPLGVGGWLALLVTGMLVLGPLLALGRYAEFAAVEHQYPDLAQMDDWASFKMAELLAMLVFCAISIYGGFGLAMKRTPDAVYKAKLVLWFNYPIAVIVTGILIPGMAFSEGAEDAVTAIPSLIASLISMGVWTAYLNRSKRVRNTYGLSRTTLNEAACATVSKSPSSASGDGVNGKSVNSYTIASYEGKGNMDQAEVSAIVDEDRVYAEIAGELEAGAQDKGLWTRLYAECDGDETMTRVRYIKQRAERLISAENIRLEQVARERNAEAEREEEVRLMRLRDGAKKAEKYISNPIPAELYASRNGMTLEQVRSLVGKGRIKGATTGGGSVC